MSLNKNKSNKDSDFLEFLKMNEKVVSTWPKWKREAAGCKMGSHQDVGRLTNINRTKNK